MTLNRYIARIIRERELRSAQREAHARLEALRERRDPRHEDLHDDSPQDEADV